MSKQHRKVPFEQSYTGQVTKSDNKDSQKSEEEISYSSDEEEAEPTRTPMSFVISSKPVLILAHR
mgnify:CR=1 FL=1|jgi:hypothetical protein